MGRLSPHGTTVEAMRTVDATVHIELGPASSTIPWILIRDPTVHPWERTRRDGRIALVDLRGEVPAAVVEDIAHRLYPTDFAVVDRRNGGRAPLPSGRVWAGPDEDLESLARTIENRLRRGQREHAIEMVALSVSVNRFIAGCLERYPPSPLLARHGLWLGHPGPDGLRNDLIWFTSGRTVRRSSPDQVDTSSSGDDGQQIVAPAWALDDRSELLRMAQPPDPELLRSEQFHCVHSISRQMIEQGPKRRDWLANLHRLVRVGGLVVVTWQTWTGEETMDHLVSDLLEATGGRVVMADLADLNVDGHPWDPWTCLAVRRLGPAVWL